MNKRIAIYLLLKVYSWFVSTEKIMGARPPKTQWIYEDEKMMGGKEERPIYFPNGIALKYFSAFESQAITSIDFWTCVSNSLCALLQILLNYLAENDPEIFDWLKAHDFIGDDSKVNISQRALAVMSGTVPGRGNSQYKVAETVRTKGLVAEKRCPTVAGMSQADFYNIPKECEQWGKEFLDFFSFFHEDFNESKRAAELSKGGLQVCVQGRYTYVNGEVTPPSPITYNHAVANVKVEGSDKNILDSYPEFLKKFSDKYPLGYPKAVYLKKKSKNVLTHDQIKFGKEIFFLSKGGKYAGKYVHWKDGDFYKGLKGDYNAKDWVEVKSLPDNMAVNERGVWVEAILDDTNWGSLSSLFNGLLGRNNDSMSNLFKLNWKDVGKAVILSAICAVILGVYNLLNTCGFSCTADQWLDLVKIALTSGLGYLVKNFLSDDEGKVLGKI